MKLLKNLIFDISEILLNKEIIFSKKNGKGIIYLVRHGATKMNQESGTSIDKIRGHIDVPLSEEGKKDAKNAANKLKNKGIEHIYSSNLKRAHDTAKTIGKATGAEVEATYDLRPWKLGSEIEGRSSQMMAPKIIHFVDNPNERPKGGETFNEFKSRFFKKLDEIKAKSKGKTIAIVTHYRNFKLLESHTGKGEIDSSKFNKKDGDRTGAIKILKDGDKLE